MRKWMIIMLLGAGLLFGSVFGYNAFMKKMIAGYMASMPVPAVPVTSLVVEQASWTPTIESIGFIEPARGVTLSTSESGLVAHYTTPTFAVVSGGVGAIVVVLLVAWRFPELRSHRR